ncbi:GSCOCG00011523001-RA-CDS [Cotesia congregata]|uniref:Similar to mthl1: Probable G-protein coupled receptor Mth-like 1 (Drosophila melanogaster) n=1 Tax=Cotesia congregata TaxID=51543 RepID=A0A8J2HDA6_COTCN|nr:GSCOCG00011523001-RA-CDS [Cotesia congregata]CAG5090843.1 Similar to mthl1: Probable G-protein coupled receptor Mth-like 1 (Drosophila melanogaster) [Cotesia congregata]
MAIALLTFLWIFIFNLFYITSASSILMLKCCKNGEELAISNNDPKSEFACVKSNTTWIPTIYSPLQKNFLSVIPNEWIIHEAIKPTCTENRTLTPILCSNISPCIIFDKGHAILDAAGSNTHISPSEYCADSKALLVCTVRKVEANRATSTIRPRVSRCCGEHAAFYEQRHSCVNQKDVENAPPLLPNTSVSIDVVTGFPSCTRSNNYTIVGNTDVSVLQSDGSLIVDGISLLSSQYCVERIKELDGKSKVFVCPEYAPQRPVNQDPDIRFMMYSISFIISSIFLGATLATGWLLPTSHHVLHWKCQTHHVLSLMLGDILMAIIQLAGDSLQGGTCKLLAILAHFFFLAAFFWLNTMCFNIWWTFRDLRPASLEKSQEILRLRVYACYAWGGPFLVAGLAALLDHLPAQPHNPFLRPRFGEKMCWFYGDTEILAYFFGPIGVLLIINVIFFIATARELTCGLWKGEFVKSTTERAALGRVCLKLVIVMGVTWVADIISWAVGGPNYLWYFTDLLNALQGLFIFIVVGWQPQVRAGLKKLFNRDPRTSAGRQGNGLSTTSHGMPSMGDSMTQNPSTKSAALETIC